MSKRYYLLCLWTGGPFQPSLLLTRGLLSIPSVEGWHSLVEKRTWRDDKTFFLNNREVCFSWPDVMSTGHNLMFSPNINRFVPRQRHDGSACSGGTLSLQRTQGLPLCPANSLDPVSNLQKRWVDLQAAEAQCYSATSQKAQRSPGLREPERANTNMQGFRQRLSRGIIPRYKQKLERWISQPFLG